MSKFLSSFVARFLSQAPVAPSSLTAPVALTEKQASQVGGGGSLPAHTW